MTDCGESRQYGRFFALFALEMKMPPILAVAKRAGRTGGRPPKPAERDLGIARTLRADPDIPVGDIANRLRMSTATMLAARTANAPDRNSA
jgi:hypothetical protein